MERLEDRLTPTTLPAGFTETLITTAVNLSRPTAMEFSPTGQLWVLQQGGAVRVVNFATGNASTAGSLAVDSSGERGLLGIAFDPSYDGAGPNPDFVYLYYTATTPNVHNRVSRFVVNNAGTATPTLGAQTVILEIAAEPQGDGSSNHNGGAIHFGPDGKLYVAVGDHNVDGAGWLGSNHVSQRLTHQHGKILRINPDGSNPTDNPFYTGVNPIRDSIYALGLRNPFTFAFQPGSGRLFINDVGEATWEEINDGIAGSNFGWIGEGTTEGFESGVPGHVVHGTYRNPIMAYDHGGGGANGCAITGGVFYPAGGSFGSVYAGKYFFADFCGGFIRLFNPATPGSISNPDRSTAFASNVSTGAPVDLKVDGAGNLYYLAGAGSANGEIYRISVNAPAVFDQPDDVTVDLGQAASFSVSASGSGPLSYQWQRLVASVWTDLVNGSAVAGATTLTLSINPVAGGDASIYRCVVSNSAGTANSSAAVLTIADQPPTIVGPPEDVSITVGESATFSVLAVGQGLTFQWQRADSATPTDFVDIDGATSDSYLLAGAVADDKDDRFRCLVDNAFGTATSDDALLSVNLLPTASISVDSLNYAFGDEIGFSGTASDPEDGPLTGAGFTWTVDFHHDAHAHPHVAPFSDTTNSSFTANFSEPDPDQFYRITLTVQDSAGGAFTTFVDILPIKVQLELISDPAGAALTIDGQAVAGPVESVVGSIRLLAAPLLRVIGETPYSLSWSDAGSATHEIITPAVNTTYTASYAVGLDARINFQDASSPGFPGYQADTGAAFGDKGNGFRFGWNKNNSANARNRNAANSPDERFDTFALMQAASNSNAFWEFAVPDGVYQVHVVAGDPAKFQSIVYRINVEGVKAIRGRPTSGQRWIEGNVLVTVIDGRLTVRNAARAIGNRIDFIDITWLAPAVPVAPQGLTATAISSRQIDLSWIDPAINETGFVIDRATDGGFTQNLVSTTIAGNLTYFQATGLAPGTTYFFRVRAVHASAGSSPFSNSASAATADAGGPFLQAGGPNFLVVMEAEHFHANTSQGGKDWLPFTARTGFAGTSAMVAAPNTGVVLDSGYAAASPRLDFQVQFVTTATHYVWIRGLGRTTGKDSLHVGLDGVETATADRIGNIPNDYVWFKNTLDGVRATIQVTTTGVHTINVWMREDGVVVDRILLTTNPGFKPANKGPAESPRAVGTGLAGAYFDQIDFTGASVSRLDPTINFNWGTGQPDPAIAAETFSVRWTGLVLPRFTETYTFFTTSSDGVQLWVNGVLIIDQWIDQPATEHSGSIALQAGVLYEIQLDYFQNIDDAIISLEWESASQAREIVPGSLLYPI